MGCACEKKQFQLMIGDQERVFSALDECVLGTTISFPENDAEAAEMMWEQAGLYNELDETEKPAILPALLDFYRKHKNQYQIPNPACSGCENCC